MAAFPGTRVLPCGDLRRPPEAAGWPQAWRCGDRKPLSPARHFRLMLRSSGERDARERANSPGAQERWRLLPIQRTHSCWPVMGCDCFEALVSPAAKVAVMRGASSAPESLAAPDISALTLRWRF